MYAKTTFPQFESEIKICPEDLIYTCGSCFAQEFYERLSVRKFKVVAHPFGIVFNPYSIAQQFLHLISNNRYQRSDLIFHNGLYHSMDHHGSFSNQDSEAMIQSINTQNESSIKSLKESSYLILTLGSAHYYLLNENQKIVSNCHKIPQNQFTKKRAEPQEIADVLSETFNSLYQLNPKLKIILSISPIRYLKDGFKENARSKASLLLAADYLCKKFSFVQYFPAYEIFMDDLRDYRYVKDDLVHPNQAAIDYIWSYFENSYLSGESKKLMVQINQFYQLLNHRILNQNASDFTNYSNALTKELNGLEKNFPQIDFSKEKEEVLRKVKG